MSAHTHPVQAGVDLVAAFVARAEARAILYAACVYTLHEAVDELQESAVRTGLVAAIGQDAVQAIIAFNALDEEEAPAVECRTCGWSPCINHTFCVACRRADAQQRQKAPAVPRALPAATISAIEYLLALGDQARLDGFLKSLNAHERTLLRGYFVRKNGGSQ
jgi:hypothetical protein